MIGVLLGLAVVAAVASVALRRRQRIRRARRQPGATIDRAVPVSRFDEIDVALSGRTCWCGGRALAAGETSRVVGARRLRIVRVVCSECERDELVYFDVTRVFH